MNYQRWLLPLFFVIYYLIPLNGRLLWMPDETRYAEISREMVHSNEWITPKLLGLRYFEKPVAGYWLNNLSQLAFGESRFAVRFASAASTGLSALLLYNLALQLWACRRKAYTASLIYLSLLIVYGIGTYSVLDALLTLWITAAMCCAYWVFNPCTVRGQTLSAIGLGVSSGIAFLTKGFIAFAIPAVALLPFLCWQRCWLTALKALPWVLLSTLLVILPWVMAIAVREPDFWRYFFWIEHIQRFAGNNAQHHAPIWFYLPWLLVGSLPWLGLLPAAFCQAWQRRRSDSSLLYLLSWVVMPLLLFSGAKGKLLTYILPCFGPLALLLSAVVIDALTAGRATLLRYNALCNSAFGIAGLGVLLLMGPQGIKSLAIYHAGDSGAWMAALTCFAAWWLLGMLALKRPLTRWSLAALCPLCLALLFAYTVPQSVVHAKQPEAFLQAYQHLLLPSRYLLSTDLALAVSAAWQLKRSDIILLDDQGELAYGMTYPEGAQRYLSRAQLAQWLTSARQQGDVALLLRSDSDPGLDNNLPTPDHHYRHHLFSLLLYCQVKA